MLAHPADLASVNTHNDPEGVIRLILQRRKSRLSQSLDEFKGRLLGANRTRATPLNRSASVSEVEGHPREEVEHHQRWLESHSRPVYGDEGRVGSESHR